MVKRNTKRATLSEVAAMQKNGELYHDANAPIGDELSADFGRKQTLLSRKVRLRYI